MIIIKRIKSVFFGLAILCAFSFIMITENKNSEKNSKAVSNLISNMSIEEKVGQMTQITIDMILKDGTNDQVDEEKLKIAILDKKVGSILNVNGHAYSIDTWHKILTRIQDVAINETANKIPVIYGIDAIHGAGYTLESTLFPHNIGMAATRNPDLVKQAAKITAMETRASGIRWNFDPTLGIGRQPLWSRFEETFGEDVYLASQFANAAVKGYEEDGLKSATAVASCMKHFLGYSYPASGKDRTPAYIPDNMLREYFLPPFEAAVGAGTSTVMINSGEVNGRPVHGNDYYLKDILRDELKFEGLAVSDWEDIIRLKTRHRIASTPEEAVKIAVNSGVDMSMVPLDYSFYDILVKLVKSGEVSEERIDEAVFKILKLKFDLGLFDNAYPEKEAIKNFKKPEYKEVALKSARESITLLKNRDNVLPLKSNSKILLVGPTANNVPSLHSSWSYTWQGSNESHYPKNTMSIRQSIEDKIGPENVISNATPGFEDIENRNIDFIKSNASKVDYIVLALGEKAYAESPGVIDDLTLEERQLKLAEAAAKTGKSVILLLVQGRPRIISSIEEGMDGVVLLYRPGSQGANATVDVLFGEYNPNGKLPYTYHRSTGDILMYDHKVSETIQEPAPGQFSTQGYNPQWPFGFGLSYTSFKYDNLKLSAKALSMKNPLEVSINVSNTGNMDGAISVELYASDLYASVTPANKRLRKCKKVFLKAGESTPISFSINKTDLSFINHQGERVTETGEFDITIGGLKERFKYTK